MADPDPNTPLSDDYLRAHRNDPEVAPYFSSAERRRLTGLLEQTATPVQSGAKPDIGAHAGVSARGRGTQLDPDKSMQGLEVATTPLAHPTGIDAIDALTSPVGLASVAAGGVGVARAGIMGGIPAAVRATGAVAAPYVKFEAIRAGLTHMGVPYPIAVATAAAAAGYRRGGSAQAEAEAAAAEVPPHLDKSVPVRAGDLTPQQLRERILQGTGEAPPMRTSKLKLAPRPETPTPPPAPAANVAAPAPVEAAPVPDQAAPAPAATSALPNQRVINDLGLAARRAQTPMTLEEIKALVPKVEGGMRPAEAVAEFAQQRVAAAPAKSLADLPGTMTDADVQAALDARHQRGEIKTPSAQTARARRGK